MAVVTTESPAWAAQRASVFRPKHMDESALVALEKLPADQQRRQAGRWLAYTYTLDDPNRAYVYQSVVDLVRGHAERTEFDYRIADLGAGNGRNTIKIAEILERRFFGSNYIMLVEQSGAALNEAKQIFSQNGLAKSRKTTVVFHQGDITDTKLSDEFMDAVTCVNVFHHLPTWDKLMATTDEINRILKPGGLFVVVDTRPLPSSVLTRHIIEGKIRGAVNADSFLRRALSEGIELDDAMIEGIYDFSRDDAFSAFTNALTKNQFNQVLRESSLSPSIMRIGDLRSPHPFYRWVYPALNIAWGVKQ